MQAHSNALQPAEGSHELSSAQVVASQVSGKGMPMSGGLASWDQGVGMGSGYVAELESELEVVRSELEVVREQLKAATLQV